MSFKDEQAQDVLPLVAMYDHKTRMHFAHACIRKGVEKHNVDNVKADLEWLGYRRFLVKSDQEHAIVALKQAAVREMP